MRAVILGKGSIDEPDRADLSRATVYRGVTLGVWLGDDSVAAIPPLAELPALLLGDPPPQLAPQANDLDVELRRLGPFGAQGVAASEQVLRALLLGALDGRRLLRPRSSLTVSRTRWACCRAIMAARGDTLLIAAELDVNSAMTYLELDSRLLP